MSASVRVRIGRGRGAPPRRPPHWADTGDPLRDPRWGFVRRLGTAFGLCASGRPRTPGPLTWPSGIWTASGMLLWLPQESPALTSLWLACVLSMYQILQAERFGLVGAHTPGDPARVPPPGPPRSARRSGTPSSALSSSDGAPPTSDGRGTSHRTSHTTTSSFFAGIRGGAGAGIGEGHDTPPPAYGSGDEGPWSLSPGSPDEGTLDDERSHGPAAGSSHKVPCRWLGPDTPGGKICGCRPGVPFTPPYVVCPCCGGPGEVPHKPPSPCDPSSPPAGWEGDCCGPSSPPGGQDGTLFHSLHRVGRDGCYCEVLCLCAIRARSDGRLSLAGPGDTTGADSETTPDRRRPRAPTVAPRPPRRLPYVGRETYGAVLALYDHLEPGNVYEAFHSMRRVCSCNPVRVKYYHGHGVGALCRPPLCLRLPVAPWEVQA